MKNGKNNTKDYPSIDLTGEQIINLKWDFLSPIEKNDFFTITINKFTGWSKDSKIFKPKSLYFAKKVKDSYTEQKFKLSEKNKKIVCDYICNHGE